MNLRTVQIYADGADPKSLRDLAKDPSIRGFTTNPTLMAKAGIRDYKGFAKEILAEISDRPFSFEVFSDDPKEMLDQAREIATWGKNVFVKIPVINTQGASCLEVVRTLSLEGTRVNITAILTPQQVFETCQSLRGSSATALVSVFAGRIADTGVDPLPIMHGALQMCRAVGTHVKLLWASCRETWNIFEADRMGCDIITVPHSILQKLSSTVGRDLYQVSLDTVKGFKKDSDAAGFSL